MVEITILKAVVHNTVDNNYPDENVERAEKRLNAAMAEGYTIIGATPFVDGNSFIIVYTLAREINEG